MNLVFDIDDTMYDLMEPFKKAHEEIFAPRTPADCTEIFIQSRICSDIVLEKEREGQIESKDAFYQRIRMTYEAFGLTVSRKEGDRFEAAYRLHQAEMKLFDFMREVLDFGRDEGIPMAVLTNGNRKGQRRKAELLGLGRWFKPGQLFVTGEIGFHKPDVRAFQAVGEGMGFHPEDTWYVGDTYESDVAGACHAGWHTVWFNHRRRPCPSPVNMADKELRKGEELLPFIKLTRKMI